MLNSREVPKRATGTRKMHTPSPTTLQSVCKGTEGLRHKSLETR